MNRATPSMREFARRLVSAETKVNLLSTEKGVDAFLVCEKLGAHLETFMGSGGFKALLQRALVLSSATSPSLGAVKMSAEGVLTRPAQLESEAVSKAAAEDYISLVAQLLGLLVAFVGERLTLRMILEVWPEFPAGDQDFGMGETK